MNHLETGVSNADTIARAAIPAPVGPASNSGLVWNGSSWVAAALVNANIDAAAAIAYSKLNLAGGIVNNDVSGSAAIAYSKLNLATSIVNADVSASAAIALSKLAATAYTAYTPTWTSSGVAPAIGNAVVVAQYLQIGKLIHAYGSIVFGTTSTYGTGTYSFALPANASANALSALQVGTVRLKDNSASAFHTTAVYLASASTMGIEYAATYLGTDSVVNVNGPWTWAVSDGIGWNITYEAA